MGGFFGAISKQDCVLDIFFGVDYHSHLGTRRGGMAIYDEASAAHSVSGRTGRSPSTLPPRGGNVIAKTGKCVRPHFIINAVSATRFPTS